MPRFLGKLINLYARMTDNQLFRRSDIGAAFQRMDARHIEVRSLINIGAGKGDDIGFFRNHWKQLDALLIDMDERFVPTWKELSLSYPGVKHVVCGAGSKDMEGFFQKTNDTGGALGSGDGSGDNTHQTPIRRIDTLVKEFAMPGPFFLKFDTHGVELDVLEGASETLKQTNLIMMECYNFKLNFVGGKNLTFDEMSLHMKSIGFRCIDMCDLLFRPGDLAFWQFHMIFIRSDHPTWDRRSYSAK